MKRFLVLIMIAVMLIGLCACGEKKPETAAKEPAAFQVGFGRVNINGSGALPLAGYGDANDRMSQGMLDYISTTCIAITDEKGETVLLYTSDHIGTNTAWIEDLRVAITEITGVPAERIMLSATHSHSAPDVREVITFNHPYYQVFKNCLVQAGKLAMEDRSKATVSSGSTTVEGLNFDRHLIMSDGGVAGDNFGNKSTAKPVSNHHESDKEVQMIRFARGDKKDILMMNFQVVPKLASTGTTQYGLDNRPMMSADVVGATRDYVEKNGDVLCAYYQGAGANLNPLDSYIKEQNTSAQDTLSNYGAALGGAVVKALPNLKEMAVTPLITTKQTALQCEKAEGGTVAAEINAICLGDIGFATAPFELFDTTGMQIKKDSPFETTFIIGYANGGFSYVPPAEVWDYNTTDGSIAFELTKCIFKQGTAEQTVQELLSMLNGLAG